MLSEHMNKSAGPPRKALRVTWCQNLHLELCLQSCLKRKEAEDWFSPCWAAGCLLRARLSRAVSTRWPGQETRAPGSFSQLILLLPWLNQREAGILHVIVLRTSPPHFPALSAMQRPSRKQLVSSLQPAGNPGYLHFNKAVTLGHLQTKAI